MAPSMYYLRKKISTSNPVIFPGNWEMNHRKGWRWVANLHYEDQEECLETLDEYLTAHGSANVTLGHSFDEKVMRPGVVPGYCGLYVRDLEDLVNELQRSLNDNDMVERWLHGD